MSIFDNIKQRLAPKQVKQAFDLVPVGVQGKPQRPQADTFGLVQSYRTNEVVYACVRITSQATVDPRLLVEKRGTKGDWAEVAGHPLRRLLMRPNPLMDEAAFVRCWVVSKMVAGEFYAEIVRNRAGQPVALYPLHPGKTFPVPDASGGIAHYEYRDGSQKTQMPVENVMVWRESDPFGGYRGASPLAVALGSVAGDIAQTNYINAFFETGGVPSGLLTIANKTLTQPEADAIRSKWRAMFDLRYGGVKNDVAVLDENATYQLLGSRMDQLASEELRGVAESRICMVFGVPPLIIYAYIGLLKANYSNLKEAWSSFWDSTLTPMFKEYRSWMTWQLLSQFENVDLIYGERVRLNWDMSAVAALQDDVDATHERARADFAAGLTTRDEGRALIGQAPAAVDGDQYAKPTAAPAPAADQQPPALPPKADDPAPEVKVAERLIQIPDDVKASRADRRDEIAKKHTAKIEKYLNGEIQTASDAAKAGAEDPTAGMDDGEKGAEVAGKLHRAALGQANSDASATLDVSIGFDIENENVKLILDQLAQRMTGVSETTKEFVRELVKQAAERGWSPQQLAAEIFANGVASTRARAMVIARTEAAAAYTKGSLLAYANSGVVKKVEWDATLDDRTSEVCQGLHGKRVPLGELFPGGYDGPPAHPNCRSAVLPIV